MSLSWLASSKALILSFDLFFFFHRLAIHHMLGQIHWDQMLAVQVFTAQIVSVRWEIGKVNVLCKKLIGKERILVQVAESHMTEVLLNAVKKYSEFGQRFWMKIYSNKGILTHTWHLKISQFMQQEHAYSLFQRCFVHPHSKSVCYGIVTSTKNPCFSSNFKDLCH